MTALNFEQARFNMVEQQIRPWDVLDDRVLNLITHTPREHFVPSRYHNLAFADVRIPLGEGQFMLNPNLEGRILQSLMLTETDRVLLVGTGSGYLAACLSKLAKEVIAVEIIDALTQKAHSNLVALGITNVTCVTGNAALDWAQHGDFDAIALTGALPTLPMSWKQRLTLNGRLFAVVGKPPIMEALLVTRTGEQTWTSESLFDTELAYLRHAEPAPQFAF